MELKKNRIELTALFKLSSTGIKVQQPEIVIVGGQSDGKSSLVEAIVGFKFNFIAVGRSH
jgi:GTP-binding protein EngB required for normal cell division